MKDKLYYLRPLDGTNDVGNIVEGVRKGPMNALAYVRVSLGWIIMVKTSDLTLLGKI